MNWQAFHWQGRVDHEQPAEMTTRLHQQIRQQGRGWQLLGFACDAGVARNQGRIGAAAGPQAIRKAAASLAWPPTCTLVDHGDLVCDDSDLETTQQHFAQAVTHALEHGPVLALGGGHETAWASGRGLLDWLAQQPETLRLGILNLDAHLDLRQPDGHQGSSGTPFYQLLQACQSRAQPVRYACLGMNRLANTELLRQRARQWQVWTVEDRHIRETRLNQLLQRLRHWLSHIDVLHLSIDLDVLPAWEAPGVSAPAAHGVPLHLLEPLVQLAASSGKLKLADLAELNPTLDIDQRTARAAARLLATMVHAHEGFLK